MSRIYQVVGFAPLKSPSPDSKFSNHISDTKAPMDSVKQYFRRSQSRQKQESQLQSSRQIVSQFSQIPQTVAARLQQLQRTQKKYKELISQNRKLNTELTELRSSHDRNQTLREIDVSRFSNDESEILKQFDSRVTRLLDENKKLNRKIDFLETNSAEKPLLKTVSIKVMNEVLAGVEKEHQQQMIRFKEEMEHRLKTATTKIDEVTSKMKKLRVQCESRNSFRIENNNLNHQQDITIFEKIFKSPESSLNYSENIYSVQCRPTQHPIDSDRVYAKLKLLQQQVLTLTQQNIHLKQQPRKYYQEQKEETILLNNSLSRKHDFCKRCLEKDDEIRQMLQKISENDLMYQNEISNFIKVIDQEKAKSQYYEGMYCEYQQNSQKNNQQVEIIKNCKEDEIKCLLLENEQLKEVCNNQQQQFTKKQGYYEELFESKTNECMNLLSTIKQEIKEYEESAENQSYECERIEMSSIRQQNARLVNELKIKILQLKEMNSQVVKDDRVKQAQIRELKVQIDSLKEAIADFKKEDPLLSTDRSTNIHKERTRLAHNRHQLSKTFNKITTFEQKVRKQHQKTHQNLH